MNSAFSSKGPEDKRIERIGNLKPTAIKALRNASSKLSPRQPTSPVEAISTPSVGSAPERRMKENCGALTPTYSRSRKERKPFFAGSPIRTSVAVSMKLTLHTFETKGKLRDARKLHSITCTSPLAAMYWMLKGPVISSAFAILLEIDFICRIVSKYVRCGGSTSVASPEWTPAFSTCSDMADTRISPRFATPSNSISFAFSTNLLMTTGYSREISSARSKNLHNSSSVEATAIAAPLSTYEGLTSTGYETERANWIASSRDSSSFHAGWRIPKLSSKLENR